MKNPRKTVSNTAQVDEFMAQLEHPLKAEVQKIREIIKNVNNQITEQIKWNAPSFSYKGEYLVTFNLRAREHIHLVFHNPMIPAVKSELLEGDYKDRRMAYFSDMADIEVKSSALEKAIKELIGLIESKLSDEDD